MTDHFPVLRVWLGPAPMIPSRPMHATLLASTAPAALCHPVVALRRQHLTKRNPSEAAATVAVGAAEHSRRMPRPRRGRSCKTMTKVSNWTLLSIIHVFLIIFRPFAILLHFFRWGRRVHSSSGTRSEYAGQVGICLGHSAGALY